jgi:hypothetical protein
MSVMRDFVLSAVLAVGVASAGFLDPADGDRHCVGLHLAARIWAPGISSPEKLVRGKAWSGLVVILGRFVGKRPLQVSNERVTGWAYACSHAAHP